MDANTTITWEQTSQWLSDPLHAGIVGGVVLLFVMGFCSIFSRAGYHWAMGLLMAIPGVNMLVFLLLAFGSWPASRELRGLRKLESAVAKAEHKYSRAA